MSLQFPYIDSLLQKQLDQRDAVFAHYTEAKLIILKKTLSAVYGHSRNIKNKKRLAPSLLTQIRIQTYRGSSVITPQFVHYPIEVYNGKTFQALLITPDIIGYPLKAFIQTRFHKYTVKNKNKKRKK